MAATRLAALAAGLAWLGAPGAQAASYDYQFKVYGVVTTADLPNGGASVGDRIEALIHIAYFSDPDIVDASGTFTDLDTGVSGSGDGAYGSTGAVTSTSAYFNAVDAYASFGTNLALDDSYGLSFTLTNGSIPSLSSQAFGPLAATGSGYLGGEPFYYDPDTGLPVGGFSLGFSVTSVSSIAAVSAVPLPASAPMFGAALLGVAGLGYGLKRKKAAATTV